MWFTEDPWPPVLGFGLAALVLFFAWNSTRRGVHLMSALGLVALALLTLVAEELIVTDAERVEAQVLALVESVKRGQTDQVIEFFSRDAQTLRDEIAGNLKLIEVQEDLRVTDLQVTLDSQANEADAHFRANGSAKWKGSGPEITGSGPTRWNLTWRKEADGWNVIQVERLNPVTGEVIGTWSHL